MCIVVCNWKLKFQRRNVAPAAAIVLQKMEKNLATEELKQIWNSTVVVVITVAFVAITTNVVVIREQRQRKFCARYSDY